ncbi:hypothetical protein HZC00_01605 [Candidatus Kaiserbacteria bacterium]|nr:hypothetical protein [Candidatus Kaiserbacteria bacterium]
MSGTLLSIGQLAELPVLVLKALPRDMSPVDTITADYDQPLTDMIAAGHYDWKNDDITAERFLVTGQGTVQLEWKLDHFDRKVSSEQAVRAIERDGWQPAKIEHLLAFGAKYPDEQCRYPIIGLGAPAQVFGYRGVPSLRGRVLSRHLSLRWWDVDWFCFCRFLSVRPIKDFGSSRA